MLKNLHNIFPERKRGVMFISRGGGGGGILVSKQDNLTDHSMYYYQSPSWSSHEQIIEQGDFILLSLFLFKKNMRFVKGKMFKKT